MTNVLAAVDGTDASARAATFARELARRFDARLTLLHVIEPYPSASLGTFGVSSSDFYARQMEQAREFLRALVLEVGVDDADQVIELGVPSEVICHEAEERQADHIVLGSHGHGRMARIMMGSVAARVASLTNRSVTIVR
jgi:nucleotide-binding universal stress UspA family protein